MAFMCTERSVETMSGEGWRIEARVPCRSCRAGTRISSKRADAGRSGFRPCLRFTHEQRGQGGQSLIEVLVATVLIGMVFLAVIAGVLTVLRSTKLNEKMQAVDSAMVAYGNIVQTQVPYLPCPAGLSGNVANDYTSGYFPLAVPPFLGASFNFSGGNAVTAAWRRPNNIAVQVVSVKSWNPDTQDWRSGCTAPDSGAQLVTYQVVACPTTSDDPACPGGKVRTASIVKRKPGPT